MPETPATAPASPTAEQALLVRLRAGDGAAFEELVGGEAARLLAVTRRILRSEEEARDALQDCFLSAFRALASFSGEARLSTWLHRIAVNAALMRLRARRRRPEELLDDLLPRFDETGHHAERIRDWREDTHGALERAELRRLVRVQIDRLPEGYRSVLVLRDIEELDTRTVAGMLELSENAVKIRLHRARQALRTLLDPHFRKGASS